MNIPDNNLGESVFKFQILLLSDPFSLLRDQYVYICPLNGWEIILELYLWYESTFNPSEVNNPSLIFCGYSIAILILIFIVCSFPANCTTVMVYIKPILGIENNTNWKILAYSLSLAHLKGPCINEETDKKQMYSSANRLLIFTV